MRASCRIKWAEVVVVVVVVVTLFQGWGHTTVEAQSSTEIGGTRFGEDTNLTRSMAMITVVLVFFFFVMGFLSIYLRSLVESRYGNPTVRREIGTDRAKRRGLDQDVIDNFPIVAYSAVKDLKIGKGALECAVCLSEFEEYETLRLLPKCDHVFHPECIDAWLVSHATCPVCRSKLTPECSSSSKTVVTGDAPQVAESRNEHSDLENSGSDVAEMQIHHVVINVDEEQSRDSAQADRSSNESSSRLSENFKFLRSNSTGHSFIRAGDNTERYTLRLPEDVRKQIVVMGTMKRSASYDVVFAMVGSPRKGYRRV